MDNDMRTHASRIHPLNDLPLSDGSVVYWMSRDQRISDNWALIHAQELALARQVPLLVLFTLADSFLGATRRHYGFMLRGLEQVAARLNEYNIPFILLRGDPSEEILRFIQQQKVGIIVTDFDPLTIKRSWREQVALHAGVSCLEVDAHNIVPCRFASDKQEYGAYTFRPKLLRLLSEFLQDFPRIEQHPFTWKGPPDSKFGKDVDIESLLSSLSFERVIDEVTAVTPGESGAHRHLHDFIINGLDGYDDLRNDPNACGQSGLSPWLHFGQLSAQRVALEITRAAGGTASGETFLEELFIRRELSDNYCWFNTNYDQVTGFPAWAQQTIAKHRHDLRESVYSCEQFEHAETHDPLWNAAQQSMVGNGTLHGYLRMYWAKKILKWSASPEEAMAIAISLNDRYQLDGRDPNGYAGIAWSIGGVHDRAWGERSVFGKIRYMNDKGCRRKFDVPNYIKNFGG
jgi:deoxyribodipyrimidine photo-lyase